MAYRFSPTLLILLLSPMGSGAAAELEQSLPDTFRGGGTLKIGPASDAREVLRAIPSEGACSVKHNVAINYR